MYTKQDNIVLNRNPGSEGKRESFRPLQAKVEARESSGHAFFVRDCYLGRFREDRWRPVTVTPRQQRVRQPGTRVSERRSRLAKKEI